MNLKKRVDDFMRKGERELKCKTLDLEIKKKKRIKL